MKTPIPKTFAVASALLLAATALAETYTWTGSSGGNWDDGDNWTASNSSTGTVPTSSDDVVFNTTVTVSLNGADRSCADFKLDDSSSAPTVTFTGSEKQIIAATFTGTGTISLSDTRLNCSTSGGSIPSTITIDIPSGATKSRITSSGGQLTVNGNITGSGAVLLNFSGSGNGGVTLNGDDSGFSGEMTLDGASSARNKIKSTSAGSESMRLVVNAKNGDNLDTADMTGDDDDPPVLKFGSLYTSARSTSAWYWRFNNSAKVIMEVGHLNGTFNGSDVDDRISVKLGESSSSGNVTIRKVGTGTLELWNAAPRYGVQIDNGTVLVTSDKAMNTYASGDIVFGHDSDATGGTLKYGVNKWNDDGTDLDEDSYVDVTTDYSSLIKNSYAPVHIDTNGKDVNYASALADSNVGGLTKDGEGKLTISSSQKPLIPLTVNAGTLEMYWDDTGTIASDSISDENKKVTVADGATLHLVKQNKSTTGLPAALYGAGTVKVDSKDNQHVRINDSTTLANFTGTLEFTGSSSGTMCGFQSSANGFTNTTLVLSYEPTSKANVFHFETDSRTLGALRLLGENAQIYVKNSGKTITIGSKANEENIINGSFVNATTTLKKSGSSTPLTLGSGFSMVSGSTLNVVEASLLTVSNDLSSTDYTVTIASGIPLAGSGTVSESQFSTSGKYVATPGVDSLTVDGAVDLDNTTLTINSFTPEDGVTSYTLLTATSFSGSLSTTTVTDSEGGEWTVAASGTTLTLTAETSSEIDPTDEGSTVTVTAESAAAATNAVTVAIPSAVTTALSNAGTSLDAATYKTYFTFTATETSSGSGEWTVAIAGLSEDEVVTPADASALSGLMDTTVAAGSDVTVTVKPGLYYAFVTGTDVTTLGDGTLTLATGTTMTYTKPADATANYLKIRISAKAE